MKVLDKIKYNAQWIEQYEQIDLDNTYFIHDITSFGKLALSVINIINKIGPNEPLARYELGY
jgi:hypothetical protein